MDGNYLLLMRVLKVHFKNRLNILDEALKVIKEYSSKPCSDQNEYDDTSQTLQNMLNDLPSDILKYFLSMVPLPKNKENLETNKTDHPNIKDILKKYLNEDEQNESAGGCALDAKRRKITVNKELDIIKPIRGSKKTECELKSALPLVKRPMIRSRRKNGNGSSVECKRLLDICVEYLIKNKVSLNQDYLTLKRKVWNMVNSNSYDGAAQEQLYTVIRDLNKKIKWMRLLDSDDVSEELLVEEYGSSSIFIKEKHMESILTEDAFAMCEDLQKSILKYIYGR